MPPNYDEIDPPPSYATLFPGNKAFDTDTSSTSHSTANSSSPVNQGAACITPDFIVNASNSNSTAQQASPPVFPSSSSTAA